MREICFTHNLKLTKENIIRKNNRIVIILKKRLERMGDFLVYQTAATSICTNGTESSYEFAEFNTNANEHKEDVVAHCEGKYRIEQLHKYGNLFKSMANISVELKLLAFEHTHWISPSLNDYSTRFKSALSIELSARD